MTQFSQIVITETDTEYLVYIPWRERDRVKKIPERRWDPSRKRWVLPLNPESRRALVSEFEEVFEHQNTKKKAAELEQKVKDLEKKIAEQERKSESLSDTHQVIKDFALSCLENAPSFAEQVRKWQIHEHLPLEIGRFIEEYLREILEVGNDYTNFSGLIKMLEIEMLKKAKDDAAEKDVKTLINLLHGIRMQRNLVVHGKLPPAQRMRKARAIFCLFGAVLAVSRIWEEYRGAPG